uniref:Uncharacterized protein n=1 Tax=Arion vulgaris TaxID=1028688 RepID=A0A0B6Y6G5_9EUPU
MYELACPSNNSKTEQYVMEVHLIIPQWKSVACAAGTTISVEGKYIEVFFFIPR